MSTFSADDVGWMRRALELAARGRGRVEPNPLVGCVLVRDGVVLGEGLHERYGGPHAEAAALSACVEPPVGGTAYVTLEPCCHLNKKTPPCVPRLIEAKIVRVVAGCVDPNPEVAGRGLEELRRAGIEAQVGLLEAECRQLNAAFFVGQLERRPYVTLKWAESSDGKVAGPGGVRRQISNELSRRAGHLLRSRSDAILIGIGTALADDPLLTTRGVPGAQRRLIRVVLDSKVRLPIESKLARTAREYLTLLYCSNRAVDVEATARAAALRKCGVEIRSVAETNEGRLDLRAVLADLYATDAATHVMVEGGPCVLRSFIESNLGDRAWVVRAPVVIGTDDAPSVPKLPADFRVAGERRLGSDWLSEMLNSRGAGYFRLAASVDFEGVEEVG